MVGAVNVNVCPAVVSVLRVIVLTEQPKVVTTATTKYYNDTPGLNIWPGDFLQILHRMLPALKAGGFYKRAKPLPTSLGLKVLFNGLPHATSRVC